MSTLWSVIGWLRHHRRGSELLDIASRPQSIPLIKNNGVLETYSSCVSTGLGKGRVV